jgi:glucan phosphoethanolaminetransferase (alkaline phosphatase superfamily)
MTPPLDSSNQKNINRQDAGNQEGPCRRSSWPAYIGFALFLFIGSRLFLGFHLNARGRTDEITSFAMVLFAFFTIEHFASGITRKILLFSLGSFLVFFHLLNGLYFRFFDTLIPFDIIRQYKDLFVISGTGLSLSSFAEILVAVLVPLGLLVYILFRPFHPKPILLIILLIPITIGWICRVAGPLDRPAKATSALPNFIHHYLHFKFRFGFDKKRYDEVIEGVNSLLAVPREHYRFVKGKGVLQEPLGTPPQQPKRYNVIFILMESFRTYECGFLGAEPSFTPGFDKLAPQARVYDNFYANGSQTVRGEFASLCSLHCNPLGVSTYLVNPSVDVISLPQILSDFGYDTLWFSGYTADFDNKRPFLQRHGIKKIIDRDVLPPPAKPIIGWGMNDEELFENVWRTLQDCNGPFFAQITTLSNHFGKSDYPTDVMAPVIKSGPEYQRYAKGIYYTDFAVSNFVERILNSTLRDNTIVIITGDHGIWVFPEAVKKDMQKREIYFRSPLCIWGPSDVVMPGVDHTVGSQVDIAPTVLEMLNIRHSNTFLGQSLVDATVPSENRFAVMYLGTMASMRIGNIWSLLDTTNIQKMNGRNKIYAKAGKMKKCRSTTYDFAEVEGDLLRGPYKTKNTLDAAAAAPLDKKLNDITFLTGYSIYQNAFQGRQ